MTKFDIKEQLIKISEDYFEYMARNYPVMCMDDEFYFFPRAKKSAKFLNFLDSLDKQKIKQDIAYIKGLKGALQKLDSKNIDLETQIDLVLLNQSMSGFLIEFDQIKIWQIDPNLYLKIILLGINHILSRLLFLNINVEESVVVRIAQIPRLLNEAKNNLREVPILYLETALEMIDNSMRYFSSIIFSQKNRSSLFKEIDALAKKTLRSLEDFKKFLIKRPSRTIFLKDREILKAILKDCFFYNKSLSEIFEIASEEYHKTLEQLAQTAKEIRSWESWQEILSSMILNVKDTEGLLGLYSGQVEKLRNFFQEKDVLTIPQTQHILIRPTPQFMEPLRTSASYNSPITEDTREPAHFYITSKQEFNNIHNEYIFITAHETYPGHHVVDSIRHCITNPIRQQVESPLFYEGWASYAERLIDELGYIDNPLQKLVGLRRQAWRAARAMLDVGIRLYKLKHEDAEHLLGELGYSSNIIQSMLRHYLLSPGYQLCYTIGKLEISKLREKFSSELKLREFHDILLQSGQIPFDLIERSMQDKLCRKDL